MTDRKVRLAFIAGGACLFIGLTLIIPGIYIGVSERHESARLRDAGQTVEAHAVAKGGTAGRHHVRISYRFRTREGEEISVQRTDIANDHWEALQRNQPLRVTYDREDPRIHRVPGQKLVGWWFVFLIVFGAIPGALGAILIRIGISRRRRG